jgi:DNA-binding XRE family transcriptional regulator
MANSKRQIPTVDNSAKPQLEINTRRLKLYLAQNVVSARRRAGITQLELAKAAALSRATVHLVEAGICDPRLSTITRLADALHVEARDLLAREMR